jgi:hypothetical protein
MVEPAAHSAGIRRRGRQKQIGVFRIFQIQPTKESEILVRAHAEIVRATERGHLSFHTKENLLGLRRALLGLLERRRAFRKVCAIG